MLPVNLLPSGVAAFIAGGYAACPALATDIDVWVSVDTHDAINPWDAVWTERLRLLNHLHQYFGFTVTEEDQTGSVRDRNRMIVRDTFEGYNLPLPIYRVATVRVEGASLPYHIIAVGAGLDEVLSSFDISTHQIALTEKGVVTGANWTPITEPPQVITEKFTTPARLEKIRARYQRKEG